MFMGHSAALWGDSILAVAGCLLFDACSPHDRLPFSSGSFPGGGGSGLLLLVCSLAHVSFLLIPRRA